MALIGISKTDTFSYVSDKDPCKRTVPEVIKDPETGEDVRTGKLNTVVDEGATTFTLGVLDVFLMGMIYDKSTRMTRGISDTTQEVEVGIVTAVNATNIDTVRFGLKGWDGFKDDKGNDLPFVTKNRIVQGRPYQVVSDECLNMLGIQLIIELGQQIKTASEVSKVEEKNSATVS